MKSIRIGLICFFCLLLADSYLIAQNELIVSQVVSPSSAVTYQSIDSSDFVVRIVNKGPNTLDAGDGIRFEYSISSSAGSSTVYDTTMIVGNFPLAVNQIREYTIGKDLPLNGDATFSACAEIKGTVVYPNNTTKKQAECQFFFVGLDETSIEISKIRFTSNQISFSLNDIVRAEAEIYDITGKVLKREKLKPQKQQTISFTRTAKGFYFLKIITASGNSSIAKFVVN